MNIPIIPEDLLEINDIKVTSFDDDILIIDNWYKNYDLLIQVLDNVALPRWKWSSDSRNFIDYYDCRPIINVNFDDRQKIQSYLNKISSLIVDYFNEGKGLKLYTDILEFNFFKNLKKDVSSNYQHMPHIDYNYNCIIYLDNISSGGTALYPDINKINNLEHNDLLIDVSTYDKRIVKAKPNRMVIFKGNVYHGCFISDHNKYVNDWRINQIIQLGHYELQDPSFMHLSSIG